MKGSAPRGQGCYAATVKLCVCEGERGGRGAQRGFSIDHTSEGRVDRIGTMITAWARFTVFTAVKIVESSVDGLVLVFLNFSVAAVD